MLAFLQQAYAWVMLKIDGKKSYLGSAAFVVIALVQFYLGNATGGAASLAAAWTAFGLRDAIAKPSTIKVGPLPSSYSVPCFQPTILAPTDPPPKGL